MKISTIAALATVGSVAAFAPTQFNGQERTTIALSAEQQSRKAFFGAAAAGAFSFARVANAGTMAQENVNDPTEVWETGQPSENAERARLGRYTNARTQLTSNFAPIKRLTLERKSPVTRLDLNAPYFTTYRKTYPGLFGPEIVPVVEEPPAEEAAEGEAKKE